MKNQERFLNTEKWKAYFDDWKSSGLSVRKWCLQHSIAINTFRYWIDKFSEQKLKKTDFQEILEKKSTNLIIRCQSFEIHVDENFDEETLCRCLSAVKRVSC